MNADDFRSRLLAGETILWTGQPAQGLVLTRRDGFLIPFSLFWGGFAIFWERMALSTPKSPTFMALWGVPFVLVGLYLIFGRFLVDAWVRGSISYALTNQRFLIARQRPTASFTAIDLERLPDATLTERTDERGTISFAPSTAVWGAWGANRNGFGAWTPSLDPAPKFLAINDARRVFDQLQRAARAKAA
jgi:hypothetical protein